MAYIQTRATKNTQIVPVLNLFVRTEVDLVASSSGDLAELFSIAREAGYQPCTKCWVMTWSWATFFRGEIRSGLSGAERPNRGTGPRFRRGSTGHPTLLS
jgi:hypothetical protein